MTQKLRETNYEYFAQLVDYDPGTGSFTWKRRLGSRRSGKPAGTLAPHGYWVLTLDGIRYYGHRVAWLLHTGTWPVKDIDHIDGDKSNNQLSNLRLASSAQNSQNVSRHKDSTSPYKNVYWDARVNKWHVKIMKERKWYHFGSYYDIEEANAVAVQKRQELHNEFARN